MDPEPTSPTTADAAAALARAERIAVVSDRDARVFAIGTALSGVVLGAYLGVWGAIAPRGNGTTVLMVVYLALAAAVGFWQSRAARAVPRGAQHTAQYALLASIGIAVVVAVALQPTPWAHQRMPVALAIAVALAVAAPMAYAARRILDRHRDARRGPAA